jgi:hypothetical protein
VYFKLHLSTFPSCLGKEVEKPLGEDITNPPLKEKGIKLSSSNIEVLNKGCSNTIIK